MQCADIETAIILAKFVHGRLGELQLVDAPEPAPTPAPAAPETANDTPKETP
jgi:hypothetical protein